VLRSQVRVEQRIFWRNVSATFFTFVLPIVLLFVLALSDDPAENVAMIIALGILSTGFQGLAIQLSMHRDQGVLKGLMATPLAPGMLVAGKVISMLVVVTLESLIVLAFGIFVLGADAPHDPLMLAAFVLLGTATFVSLGFAVASIIPSSDSAPAIVNAAYLGLILASVLTASIDSLPDVVQRLGDALPLVHLFEPIRNAWLFGSQRSDITSAIVLAAWGIAGAIWTVRRFRWEPSEQA
jgi:ABC-2 type transport system permease protein